MTDPMTPYDFILAAGLDSAAFATRAWAPAIADKPALVSGISRGEYPVIIRAWPLDGEGTGWAAQAIIGSHPQLVLEELEPEEAERLRAESQTATGLDAPVGQEAVIGRSDPKLPYAPPVQPLPEPTPGPLEGEVLDGEVVSEVTVHPLDCGPNCVQLVGPQGTIQNHSVGCELGQ